MHFSSSPFLPRDVSVMFKTVSSLSPRFATWVTHRGRSSTTKTVFSESFDLAGTVTLLPLAFSQALSVFHAKVDEAEFSSQ